MSEDGFCDRELPGLVDGQFLESWEPGLSGPGWSSKEKLCIRLMQFGQDLGEKLIRREGLCPQILPWKREGVDCQGPGVLHWGHKGWEFGVSPYGKQVHIGRAP